MKNIKKISVGAAGVLLRVRGHLPVRMVQRSDLPPLPHTRPHQLSERENGAHGHQVIYTRGVGSVWIRIIFGFPDPDP